MFEKCHSADDAKKLYRRLSKYLHPDVGGDSELMSLLTESYEERVAFLSNANECSNPFAEAARGFRTKTQQNVEKIREDDSRLYFVDDLVFFANEKESFDASFVNDVVDVLNERGYITNYQYDSLFNIYQKWHVRTWCEKHKESKHTKNQEAAFAAFCPD